MSATALGGRSDATENPWCAGWSPGRRFQVPHAAGELQRVDGFETPNLYLTLAKREDGRPLDDHARRYSSCWIHCIVKRAPASFSLAFVNVSA